MRLIEYVEQGGPIMYILLALNIIGLSTMAYKFFLYFFELQKLKATAQDLKQKTLETANLPKKEGAEQQLGLYIGKLESGLNTIKVVASISPLLGLLGTVVGVYSAFQTISQVGLNDPSIFASGISMALITTVGGLIVSIPHYIGHSYLLGLLDTLERKLEHELLKNIL